MNRSCFGNALTRKYSKSKLSNMRKQVMNLYWKENISLKDAWAIVKSDQPRSRMGHSIHGTHGKRRATKCNIKSCSNNVLKYNYCSKHRCKSCSGPTRANSGCQKCSNFGKKMKKKNKKAAQAMRIKNKQNISLKEAWKQVNGFGYLPETFSG